MVTTAGLSRSAMSANEPGAGRRRGPASVAGAATRPAAGADWAGDGVRLPASDETDHRADRHREADGDGGKPPVIGTAS